MSLFYIFIQTYVVLFVICHIIWRCLVVLLCHFHGCLIVRCLIVRCLNARCLVAPSCPGFVAYRRRGPGEKIDKQKKKKVFNRQKKRNTPEGSIYRERGALESAGVKLVRGISVADRRRGPGEKIDRKKKKNGRGPLKMRGP